MKNFNDTHPPVGLCFLQDLPEPYQLAFRQGSAHHLPGEFLPVQVDWFTQICLLPFGVIYALPPLTLPWVLLNPKTYGRFFQIIRQQNLAETAFMLGLLALGGILLVYCAWIAWDTCSSFVRTWQAHQLQRHSEHGFGLVLLERGMVARLIDNIDFHNCFWLPREAIANIIWQQVREEGAKHSRWVYRTQLCYVTEDQGKQQKRWLTFKGYMFKTGYPTWDSRGDRALFEQFQAWWQAAEPSQTSDP